MSTKALSAVATFVTFCVAGNAAAQLPAGTFYNSGFRADYPAGALDSAGFLRVTSTDGRGDTDWTPELGGTTFTGPNYHKVPDGTAHYFIASGDPDVQIYDLATRTWFNPPWYLSQPHWGQHAAWDNRFVWIEDDGSETFIVQYDHPGMLQAHLLGNGISEQDPSLSGNRVAYSYYAGGFWRIAVYELGVGHLYYGVGQDPDVLGDRVAWMGLSGEIHWTDFISGGGYTIYPSGSCSRLLHPLFVGTGRWIVYAADCAGGYQLRVHDTANGFDQYFSTVYFEDFHAGPSWITWVEDGTQELRAYVFGSSYPDVPIKDDHDTRFVGNDPALVLDSRWDVHAVFTDGNKTFKWDASSGSVAIGDAMRAYSGDYRYVVAERSGTIWQYDVDSPSWAPLGDGEYPSAWDKYALWTNRYLSPDFALSSNNWPDLYVGDGIDQSLPAFSISAAAIEAHDGIRQKVEVIEVTSGALLASFSGSSHKRTPDLWHNRLVYVDDVLGLRWLSNYASGVERPVPVPAGCRPRLPRLGFDGSWVLYEAFGCTDAGLYLANMLHSTPTLHRVGRVVPPRGFTPQYDTDDRDWIVFVDADLGGLVRVIRVDASAL